MDASRILDRIIPGGLHRYAGEDNGEDGSDPEDNHYEADHVDRASKETIWEDSYVGGHDGELGEGD